MEMLVRFAVCFFLMTSSIGSITGDAVGDLTVLLKEYYEWRMEERPEVSTYSGYHKYNDVLEVFLESQFDKRKTMAQSFLTKLQAISRDKLDRKEKINYDILENMLKTFIAGYEWRYYNTINPMTFLAGPQRNPDKFWYSFPFYTIGDFENYIARLRRLSTQLDEIMTLFRLAMNTGTAYHRVSVNLVIEQIAAICPTSNYSVNCGYYHPFMDKLDQITVTTATRENIRSRAQEVVGQLMNTYQNVSSFLQTEYIPATRKTYGVVNLVRGKEYYQACLKWYLALDLTPEQVHQLGLTEVARIHGEMQKIMTRNSFDGSVSEYFEMLKNDSSMFFQTSAEMLAEYEYLIKERIDPVIPKLFKNLPNLPLIVKATPSDGPLGTYSPGSADGSRPGIFYANVLSPNETLKIAMVPLTMHETSPGHHLQLSYNAKTSTPDFRSKMETGSKWRVPFAFPSYTAFTEGWALYAESLGEELNIYRDDDELMGRYSEEIFRACRLVVDTGIHYYNWTKEKAVDYIATYTSLSSGDINVEVDRYITIPGQACSYKIGELKIKELRVTAAKRLEDGFDVRDFHTFIMESGVVPLNVLERNVNDWIEDQLKKSTDSNLPATCATETNSIHISLLVFVFVVISFNF